MGIKISDLDAQSIREQRGRGVSVHALATVFNVNNETIRKIVRGETHKHAAQAALAAEGVLERMEKATNRDIAARKEAEQALGSAPPPPPKEKVSRAFYESVKALSPDNLHRYEIREDNPSPYPDEEPSQGE